MCASPQNFRGKHPSDELPLSGGNTLRDLGGGTVVRGTETHGVLSALSSSYQAGCG